MNGRKLGSSEEQRDPGKLVHRSLKVAGQVNRVIKKECGTLAFISHGVDYNSREIMLVLSKTLVRPQLEYWKDEIALEEVRTRFIRMLPGIEKFIFEERQDKLRPFSLEQREMRGDLTEAYKIMRGMDRVIRKQLFPFIKGLITRQHNFNVEGREFRGDLSTFK
eukprot:g30567.t1